MNDEMVMYCQGCSAPIRPGTGMQVTHNGIETYWHRYCPVVTGIENKLIQEQDDEDE